MWTKIKSWFGSSGSNRLSPDEIKESFGVIVDSNTNVSLFVEQFAKAASSTHSVRDEFNRSAMFSEHSIDLFVQVCTTLHDMTDLDDDVSVSIITQMWIRLAREVVPDDKGLASMLDYMKIAQRWHLKVIEKIKSKEPAEYFLFINFLERSLLQSIDVLDSMARVETTDE